MADEAILRHLTRNHPDVLNEFDSIVRMVALDKYTARNRRSERNPSHRKVVTASTQAAKGKPEHGLD